MKTTNMMGKLVLAALGGCATSMTAGDPGRALALDKTGTGIFYGRVGPTIGVHSTVADVCAKLGAGDTRCAAPGDYDAKLVQFKVGSYDGIAGVITLIPKTAGVQDYDIVKVHIVGTRPAYFDAIAAHLGDKSCYWDGYLGYEKAGVGSVVCPKYGWNANDMKSYDTILGKTTVVE